MAPIIFPVAHGCGTPAKLTSRPSSLTLTVITPTQATSEFHRYITEFFCGYLSALYTAYRTLKYKGLGYRSSCGSRVLWSCSGPIRALAGVVGHDPTTYGLTDRRYYQLSYTPRKGEIFLCPLPKTMFVKAVFWSADGDSGGVRTRGLGSDSAV